MARDFIIIINLVLMKRILQEVSFKGHTRGNFCRDERSVLTSFPLQLSTYEYKYE